jgi:hypothetical protein
MGEFISSSTKWRSDFNEGMKRKYDILQQHADTEGRVADNQMGIAKMQFGEGGVYDRNNTSQQGIARMHYGPGGAVDRSIAANAPFNAAQTADILSKTGIATQKWQNFDRPALTSMKDMFDENFDIMKSNKRKSLALEGRAYDSPEFAQKTYGLTPPVSAVQSPALAKPRQRPSWWTGKQTTPFEEERSGPMFTPYGGGESNPINWLMQPAVPFMRMFR